MQTVDPVIPISNMINRYENMIDDHIKCRAALRWWERRKRFAFTYGIVLLQEEIDLLLKMAGSCQPIIRDYVK